MKIANIEDFVNPSQRVGDSAVAVLVDISENEWKTLHRMCGDFFSCFENSLRLTPISHFNRITELWLTVAGHEDLDRLHEMEIFVRGWVSGHTSNNVP